MRSAAGTEQSAVGPQGSALLTPPHRSSRPVAGVRQLSRPRLAAELKAYEFMMDVPHLETARHDSWRPRGDARQSMGISK